MYDMHKEGSEFLLPTDADILRDWAVGVPECTCHRGAVYLEAVLLTGLPVSQKLEAARMIGERDNLIGLIHP